MIGPIHPIPKNGKPKLIRRRMTYEHRQVLNQLLKTIGDCEMDDTLKMLLRMKIWGKHPAVFQPMSHKQIAKDLGAKVESVKKWEQEALYYVKGHLGKKGMEDITGSFNEDHANKGKLFKPGGRIIIP